MTYDELLDNWLAQLADRSDLVPQVEAEKFVAFTREKHSAELNEWLDERAVFFTREAIRARVKSQRSAARRAAKPQAFAAAVAETVITGTTDALSPFLARYVVDDEHTQRLVRDMTGTDHLFVAASYERSGRRDLMEAAFHRAVAKAVGDRRTCDVMDEAQYDALRRSITDTST